MKNNRKNLKSSIGGISAEYQSKKKSRTDTLESMYGGLRFFGDINLRVIRTPIFF